MKNLAFACILFLAIVSLSWALPSVYERLMVKPIEKTNLFYSPVLEKCIYTEQIRGYDAQAAQKSEGHHADIVYKDEDDQYYNRLEFEANLPFIYYRNMEMRGLLPLHLAGQIFDRKTIEQARRVLELPARELIGKRPTRDCLPLLEANPGQVALLYPDDRFRLEKDGISFLNADLNKVDQTLSQIFTSELKAKGLRFPVRSVGGNFTTFKPFEGGIFLIDADGKLFHLIRRNNKPEVTKVLLPEGLVPKHVLVSESREGLWLALILDQTNDLWLLRQKDFALFGFKVPNYDPQTMDCKLIFNPLFITVITSDSVNAHLAVFHNFSSSNPDNGTVFQPFHTFTHKMSRAEECWQTRLADTIFPFRFTLQSEDRVMLQPVVSFSKYYWNGALPFCFFLAGMYFLRRKSCVQVIILVFTGLYGLIPLLLLNE